MNRKNMIKITLVTGLFLISLGGWMLHLRIHPFSADDTQNIVPLISGVISVFCLPLLFYFRKTVTLAYVVNGFLVIAGTVTMTHLSIATFKDLVTLPNVLLKSTLADIAILWGKFALGRALFILEFLKSDSDIVPKGRFFRYPNMGWWWVHLFAISSVYSLGNMLWK